MKQKIETTKSHQSRGSQKPPLRIDAQMMQPDQEIDAKAVEGDVVDLILKDHVPLKKLIATLKDADLKREDKSSALEEFVPLLLSHAKAEQQSLYVEMKELSNLRIEGFEGETEHAIAEQLAQEINATPDDDEWLAKVKVLAVLVENHIKTEEEQILPDVKAQLDASTRVAVGCEYTYLKADFDILLMNSDSFRNELLQ